MGQNLSKRWNTTSRQFLLNKRQNEQTVLVLFDTDCREVFAMGQWEIFLSPYKQAVDELKVKLKGMRSQFGIVNANSPIEFVTDV